ncbi:Phosducin-domain-containing protein [Blastocladiella britannica]|nr:Phosducin-domain-containing protein [Blastocladiella britannica]
MTDLDERLIKAIQRASLDPTSGGLEPRAMGEAPDKSDRDPDAVMGEGPFGGGGAPLAAHGGPQTGPKGVLADYRYTQQSAARAADDKRAAYIASLDRAALRSNKGPRDSRQNSDEDEDEDDEDTLLAELDAEMNGDDNESPALRAYRTARVAQMSREQRDARPVYGTFREIGVTAFVREIEQVPRGTAVVVHIYEPSIPDCNTLNGLLIPLSSRYARAKFVRIRAAAADPDMDPVALPVLQVYRGGSLVSNMVRVIDDLEVEVEAEGKPRVITSLDLEHLLLSQGALLKTDEYRAPGKTATSAGSGGSGYAFKAVGAATRRGDSDSEGDD